MNIIPPIPLRGLCDKNNFSVPDLLTKESISFFDMRCEFPNIALHGTTALSGQYGTRIEPEYMTKE